MTTITINFPTIKDGERAFRALLTDVGVKRYTLTNRSLDAYDVPSHLTETLTRAIKEITDRYRCECLCCKGTLAFYS